MPLVDLEVLEGGWEAPDRTHVVLDGELAQKALDNGELEQIVRDALAAMYLSGKKLAYISEDA